ncbi:MAG: ATP-dependent Clp protease ATP-binding subunit, partial [Clostridia bacterium]|nr:ATP-dependent Clp protease ATP-binding subunit [Clostridia bacterium]
MKIQVCVRCKKRPASVYVTRLDGGNSVSEGLCFQCAAELGIKPPPVVDMLKKMGIDEDAIQGMTDEINGMMENALVESEDGENGKVPTLNLGELFGFPSKPQPEKNGNNKKPKESKGEDPSKKLLSTYCANLNQKAAEGKIDRIIGRDREIDRMIQILCRRQKNNPCLIGEPG